MKQLRVQRGMTLIEMMIAGLLGLIVTYFIVNVMISSNRTALTSDGLAQAQESGRFVMSWLQEEVRRAGYSADPTQTLNQPFADVCTGTATPPSSDADCTYEATDEVSDRIALRWLYDSDSTSERDQEDCTGTALSTSYDGTVLIDVYWVEQDFGSDGDDYDDVLRCATYSEDSGNVVASAQTIASGTLGMQVLYGVSSNSGSDDSDVTQYVAASEVTDWALVRSARISVLTRAFNTNTLDQSTRSYILLDAEPYTYTDRTARYILSSTFFLPNTGL